MAGDGYAEREVVSLSSPAPVLCFLLFSQPSQMSFVKISGNSNCAKEGLQYVKYRSTCAQGLSRLNISSLGLHTPPPVRGSNPGSGVGVGALVKPRLVLCGLAVQGPHGPVQCRVRCHGLRRRLRLVERGEHAAPGHMVPGSYPEIKDPTRPRSPKDRLLCTGVSASGPPMPRTAGCEHFRRRDPTGPAREGASPTPHQCEHRDCAEKLFHCFASHTVTRAVFVNRPRAHGASQCPGGVVGLQIRLVACAAWGLW